jgi:hypothetical protein
VRSAGFGSEVHNDRGESSRRNTLLDRVCTLPCGCTLWPVLEDTADGRGERAQWVRHYKDHRSSTTCELSKATECELVVLLTIIRA